MSMKGAIFDMDGTLLDSMPMWDTLGDTYLLSKRIDPRPGLAARIKTMSMTQVAGHFIEEYGLTGSVPEVIADINAMIDNFYRETVPLKAGAADFLDALAARGVRMAVATATDRPLAEAALGRLGVLRHFAAVCTCTEVGAPKTRPDVFDHALALLGTAKAETVVFEDSLYAAQTAHAAGYRVAGLFDQSSAADGARMQALCGQYLHSFAEWRDM